MQRNKGSFRDLSGTVFSDGDRIIRTINLSYAEHWDFIDKSGFLPSLVKNGSLVAFEAGPDISGAWKSLTVEKIPFITYPYEWCFGQLKDAALLTLDIQLESIKHGAIIKDASAYNVQFVGCKPIFIDILSFEKYAEGEPWIAYGQFCSHFLTSLALASKVSLDFLKLSRIWMDGIPLDFASRTLPWKTRFIPRLFWHLHLHAKMQDKHADRAVKEGAPKKVKVAKQTLIGLAESLRSTVAGLTLPSVKTEWGDYYDDTNYSEAAAGNKADIVERIAAQCSGRLALDIGANTGFYSAILAKFFGNVISADVDQMAVEKHYAKLKKDGTAKILPMVLDVLNPSPGIGWCNEERDSFIERIKGVDFVAALALIHHLAISSNVPLDMIAEFFARILNKGAHLLLEFVPKDDSQVQRLLATREDIFVNYDMESLLSVFDTFFALEERIKIEGSARELLLFESKVGF